MMQCESIQDNSLPISHIWFLFCGIRIWATQRTSPQHSESCCNWFYQMFHWCLFCSFFLECSPWCFCFLDTLWCILHHNPCLHIQIQSVLWNHHQDTCQDFSLHQWIWMNHARLQNQSQLILAVHYYLRQRVFLCLLFSWIRRIQLDCPFFGCNWWWINWYFFQVQLSGFMCRFDCIWQNVFPDSILLPFV